MPAVLVSYSIRLLFHKSTDKGNYIPKARKDIYYIYIIIFFQK
jgi:hypothetical protein